MEHNIEKKLFYKQKEYASSILEYSLEHNLNFKTYAENSGGSRKIWIWLTNSGGVPNIFVVAELNLIHDKIYCKQVREKESEGLIRYLKTKFPRKIKKMDSKDF